MTMPTHPKVTEDRPAEQWEHARVTLYEDLIRVWGDVVIWSVDRARRRTLESHDDRDEAVCRLGATGFELVTVTASPQNADGVWRESMWFRRGRGSD